MSLVGTLAKVAIGVAVAKGVSSMAKGASQSQASQASAGGGLGDLLGGMLGGGGAQAHAGGGLGGLFDQLSGAASGQSASGQSASGQLASGGGLGDLLGGLLGGAGQSAAQPAQQGGGLGDLLGGLMGGQSAQGAQGGGLADMLGGLLGGQTSQAASGAQGGSLADMLGGLMGGGAAAGGLGGLLGALTGGQAGAQAANDQSFGQILNSSLANQGEPDVAPTPHQNAAAALMLSAMIQAAKSDGAIQDDEKQKLLSNLGDATPEEMAFVKSRLDAPVSIPDLVKHVPAGMQAQVYSMSLMAINLDSQAEAQYLNDLAHALGLNKAAVNQIHAHVGAPALYA